MSPKQAAIVIGCTTAHVRLLIRKGKLRAKRIPRKYGYTWFISPKEVERYRDTPVSCGFPRGHKRTNNHETKPNC